MNLEEIMASTPPMQQHALIKGFQAGAASRDAEVAELKQQIDSIKLSTPSLDAIGVLAPHPRTLMENYRKVLQAEHDAEIAEYKQERDQLREHVTMLREALKEAVEDYSDRFDMSSQSTNPGIKWIVKQGKEVLAATEPKP